MTRYVICMFFIGGMIMDINQIIIIISLLAFFVVGLLVKKSSMSSFAGFTMSKGKLNWFTIAAGISMTFAGGAAILTSASIGHVFKWYSLIDPISLMFGLLIVLLFYKKYERDHGTTISDLLSSNHKGLTVLTGLITSFTFLLIVAANFVALSKLLAPYFPTVNPLLITFVVSTLIFSYVFFGGFNSVTRTDILQYILITGLLIFPTLFFVINHHGQLIASDVSHKFVAMPIDYMILFAIPAVFTPLSQDINLRIKSAKNPTHGKIGLMMGGLFYFSIALSAAYIGIYLGNNNVVLPDPEQAIPLFFRNNFPHFGFLAIIAALAAIVSTLDSYVLNAITSISNDLIKPFSKQPGHVSKKIKIASLITYIVAMAIALFFNQVLLLSLTSLLVYISVLLPIVLGKFLRLPGRQIFIGSVINIATFMTAEILSWSLNPRAVIYPVFGCLVMLVIRIIKSMNKNGD